MAEFIKSSSVEAENESNMITMKEGMIQAATNLIIGATNLSVVDNLQEANTMMNSCNTNYKNLLRSHAESIAKLGKEFSDFDSDLADKMGVTKE